MLKLERVSKYYFTGNNVVQALRRITLEFTIGEFVAITGKSGSGKSTLLNVLSGLDTYEEGKLFFNGQDISHYTIEELEYYRKDNIGYIFQEHNLINSYTVYQNIEIALTIQGYTKKQIKSRVLQLIDRVGLSKMAHRKVSKLSGGERQRTVIARTLAKDYQILMCDEPTGNLNKEASDGIFQLLLEISKDKLVIVVTHDISLLQKYVTRKIHLYDGEIMEDSTLSKHTDNLLQNVSPKVSHTSILGSIKIALRNVFSVPKKSLFSLLTITFMLAMIFFIYSAGLTEINKSFSSTNPYFTNTDPSRIILIKNDKTLFTPEELLEISQVDNVRGVFDNDMVFDSVLVAKIYSEELATNKFYYFKPLPSLALDESRLMEGNLPENANEVVVGNNGLYNVGDRISIANDYLILPTQDLKTDQFEFIVTGIIEEPSNLEDDLHYFYLSNAGLTQISKYSIYENSEISIRIEGTKVYNTPTDTWITPEMVDSVGTKTLAYEISYPTWVRIDNSIADNQILTFDMMYFDICRDFGYKVEVRDDSDAGLCNATAFIESHTLTYRAITTFENDKAYEEISFISTPYTSDDQTLKLFMNESTFSRFFDESGYQITVIVRGSFEGNQVVKELKQLGYNTFYPSQIIDSNQALMIVINNILVTLIVGVLLIAICFVGHFVINKLLISKLTDYLIIRFIGASKTSIKRIVQFEILFITLVSAFLLLIFIIISKQNLFIVEDSLRYYKWIDYLLLVLIVLCVMEIMVVQFTRKVFKASVVSALKGAE